MLHHARSLTPSKGIDNAIPSNNSNEMDMYQQLRVTPIVLPNGNDINSPSTLSFSPFPPQASIDGYMPTTSKKQQMYDESQVYFDEVLEQLSAKEDSIIERESIFSLPSMEFLEGLLDEMDSRTTSAGEKPAEPPMYLPIDSFDLPDLYRKDGDALERKRATGSAQGTGENLGAASAPCGTAGTALGTSTESFIRKYYQERINTPSFIAPEAGSAAPSPVKSGTASYKIREALANRSIGGTAAAARRQASENKEKLRPRNENSFLHKRCGPKEVENLAGMKRKADDSLTYLSAPAILGGQTGSIGGMEISPNSRITHEDSNDNDEVSKAKSIKGHKNRRTVCLNCGSYQTPQWRCGPLGPRTLCNACGVRFKKGLPLNCWPLRNGMVLPPGATLPPSVQIPPGMTINVQPFNG